MKRVYVNTLELSKEESRDFWLELHTWSCRLSVRLTNPGMYNRDLMMKSVRHINASLSRMINMAYQMGREDEENDKS